MQCCLLFCMSCSLFQLVWLDSLVMGEVLFPLNGPRRYCSTLCRTTEKTSCTSFWEGEITPILHIIRAAGGALRHPCKRSRALQMPPQKRFSAQDTPQKERNHPKTTVYNHYDQSYQLMQTPDQTSNNAIFSVFKHTNHAIWAMDHMSWKPIAVYDHSDQSYQFLKKSGWKAKTRVILYISIHTRKNWIIRSYQLENKVEKSHFKAASKRPWYTTRGWPGAHCIYVAILEGII